MQPSEQLEVMAAIAQPLDEWCEFCTTKLAVMKSEDGVGACQECAEQVLKAMAKYEAEAREAASVTTGAWRPVTKHSSRRAAQAKARAKRRAKRKRTKR